MPKRTMIVFDRNSTLTVSEPPDRVAQKFSDTYTGPVEFESPGGRVFVNWANVLYIEPARESGSRVQ